MRKERKSNINSSLIVMFLLVFGLVNILLYIFKNNHHLPILDNRLLSESISTPHSGPILAGEMIVGHFESKYPNLSTLKFSFNARNIDVQDTLIFRIIEEKSDKLIFENQVDLNGDNISKPLDFKFPEIVNSRDQNYVFEIQSLDGTSERGVSLDLTNSTIIAESTFNGRQLLKNPHELFYLIVQKLIIIFSDPRFYYYLGISSLPILAYVVLLCTLSMDYQLFASFTLIVSLIDTLLLRGNSDYLLIISILLWVITVYRYRIDYRSSTMISIGYYALAMGAIFLHLPGVSEKATAWGFLFLSVVVFQIITEEMFAIKVGLNVTEFWKELLSSWKEGALFIYGIATNKVAIETNITKKPNDTLSKHKDTVQIIISRQENFLAKTVIITSLFIAGLIIIITKLIRISYIAWLYVLILFILKSTIHDLGAYSKFYLDFFDSGQYQLYWSQVGTKIVTLYVLIVAIFTIYQNKLSIRKKAYLAIILLFLAQRLSGSIFGNATGYKYNVEIRSVRPNGSMEPWVDITIYGRNFNDRPFVGKVYINNVEQRVIEWTDKEIIFRTNPRSTTSGLLRVSTFRNETSNQVDFIYSGNR